MSDNTMNYPGTGTETPTEGFDRPSRSGEDMVREKGKKMSRAVRRGYDQTMEYGREHPGQMNMVMFGVGLGVGLFLASRFPAQKQRYRYRLVARPLIEALAEVGRVLTR